MEMEINMCLSKVGHPQQWLKDHMQKAHESGEQERQDLITELRRLENTSMNPHVTELVNLTLDYLNRAGISRLRPSISSNGVKAVQIEALHWNFQRCLYQLERLSNDGDSDAIKLLARHSLNASSWLSKTRVKHPKLIKPIARKSVFWPVLKSRCLFFDDIGKPTHQSDAVFLRDLEVGKDHTIQGYKVKFSDEVGGIILNFLNQVNIEKAGDQIFFPVGWRLKASKLPPLSTKKNTIDKWAEVLQLSLIELHSSREAMAANYKHLVSRKKQVGVRRILGELQHLIRTKLANMAGAGRNADSTTPSGAWLTTRTKNIIKRPSA